MIVHTFQLIAHTPFDIENTPYMEIQVARGDQVIAKYLLTSKGSFTAKIDCSNEKSGCLLRIRLVNTLFYNSVYLSLTIAHTPQF